MQTGIIFPTTLLHLVSTKLNHTSTPSHTHTYHKLVDSQPVDLRACLVNESDSDPPLDALLKKEGPHAPLVLHVVHRGRNVLPSWTELTDLKVG